MNAAGVAAELARQFGDAATGARQLADPRMQIEIEVTVLKLPR